ncbi:aldehyde dehydrogenase-like protein [Saccharata proteae CBS 121410]|uniref:aldehyde dehydrogenase (NAD(+)) n=1 Tax=Saccharata proteae CBS 121410 TaxID=1314787 RepID=A0A9P4HL83_9PEZI|nr:aldehyde dehydrogenase-like protein [Saccharata proteae CBS 121410]
MDFSFLQDGYGSQPYILLGVSVATTIVALLWLIFDDPEPAVDFTVAPPEQCHPGWKGEVLEKPSLKVAGSDAIQCYCPADGRLLGHIQPAKPDDIDQAIADAKEAQVEWARTSFAQRRRVLKTILKFILENQETISTAACLDSGKTRIDSSFGEILVTAEKLKWTIAHGEKALKPERRPTNFLMMYKVNEVHWEPLGVIAACVSWNYPFHNLLGPIISALFSGNAILVKVSEQTAWSSQYFTSIVHGALSACGFGHLAPSLVRSLVCWPSVAPHLTSHPGISHITFIGSRPVAHAVCESAAKALTPVCVELGGKDAAIVLDDVRDLEKVGHILLRGVFQAAGQNCVGMERIIALDGIYDRLLAFLTPRIRALRQGSVLASPNSTSTSSTDKSLDIDVGASISDASFTRLESLIADAVSAGATLLAGGQRHHHPSHPSGHYFAPTLLANVTPSMRIAQEECFGPILLLMRASSIPAAITIANSTPYGLGASVFGSSRSALAHITRNLEAGMVSVNDFAVYYAVQLPFGGVKGSGYGRFAGEEGLRGICNTKAVCRDRWPGWVETGIPEPLRLPVPRMGRGWEVARGVVELGYGLGWGQRVGGLRKIIGI